MDDRIKNKIFSGRLYRGPKLSGTCYSLIERSRKTKNEKFFGTNRVMYARVNKIVRFMLIKH